MNAKRLAASCFLLLSIFGCAFPDLPWTREEASPPPWRDVLVANVRLPEAGAPAVAALSRLLEQGRAVPEVQQIAVADALLAAPGAGRRVPIFLEGRPPVGRTVRVRTISSEYFKLMGIPLRVGRPFTEGDREGSPLIAIVSYAFAKEEWPDESPLGERIRIASSFGWLTVVGVVQDLPSEKGAVEVYLPYTQARESTDWLLLVRTAADPARVAARLRESLPSTDPGLVLGDFRSLEEALEFPDKVAD
jgi:hypothetical protein